LGSDSFGIPTINFGIFHKPVLRRIALWTYKQAPLLLGISEFQNKNLKTYGVLSATIIPWGIERNVYKFINKQRSSPLRIIHVGHLTPVKDQVTLIKAFALIVKQFPAELRIYGVDCMKGAIQKISCELGIEKHIQFLEMVSYERMSKLYGWADMMLHTSIVEGQSMALTEAAASGVLLAGTRVGILHDLGDSCGITIEVGDFEDLAKKVLNILEDAKSWDEKIQNARKWTDSHDLQWTIDELKSSIHSLLHWYSSNKK